MTPEPPPLPDKSNTQMLGFVALAIASIRRCSASRTLCATGGSPSTFSWTVAKAIVQEIRYQVDINTLHKIEGVESFNMNEIGRVKIRTAVPLLHDAYRRNRATGAGAPRRAFTRSGSGGALPRAGP